MTPYQMNQVQQMIAAAVARQVGFHIGIVTAYDPNRYAVKASVQPEDVETAWLPLASVWVGNGWGIFAPPSIGDPIELHFEAGVAEAGYAFARVYSDELRPLPCPSGEFWLVHKSGSSLKFTNDGDVLVTSARDMRADVTRNLIVNSTTATISASSHVEIDSPHVTMSGDLVVSGDIKSTGGDVKAGAISLKTHVHPDPQGGLSGIPQ